MMPAVLTMADKLTCTFTGLVTPGDSKLVVAGQPVLTETGVSGQTVAGCKPTGSPPPPACATVGTITAGKASKLVIGGAPALLDGMTASTEKPATHVIGPVSAGQSKLEAS